ncbi:MAG: uracil phosphoribosyltransferase [Xenococcaceae cyanobacterium]
MTLQLRVYVPDHLLIKHWLAVARDAHTPSVLFKTAMVELGRWLTYEAVRTWLPTLETTVTTPITETAATIIDSSSPLAIVPILRAGLAMLEGAQTLLPLASIYHFGIVRNEETLEATCYLNKLPEQFAPQTRVIIVEPMMATGGSIAIAMEQLTKRGVEPASIIIVSAIVAPPALRLLSEHYPQLSVYTATIDEGLNSKGYIVPGLGDAGDRAFGTQA